jgi:hypothetical protein
MRRLGPPPQIVWIAFGNTSESRDEADPEATFIKILEWGALGEGDCN